LLHFGIFARDKAAGAEESEDRSDQSKTKSILLSLRGLRQAQVDFMNLGCTRHVKVFAV